MARRGLSGGGQVSVFCLFLIVFCGIKQAEGEMEEEEITMFPFFKLATVIRGHRGQTVTNLKKENMMT